MSFSALLLSFLDFLGIPTLSFSSFLFPCPSFLFRSPSLFSALGMGDHPQDAPSLVLEDETESLVAGQNLILVGKILAPKPLRKQGVLHTINAMWRTKKGVTTSSLGENMYGFSFESEDDLNRVYDLAPWSIMGRLLVLRRWGPSESLEELDFDHGPFWIQAHGLPLSQMTESNGMKIGNLVGSALKVQNYGGDKGAILGYLRIRVLLDLTKPLLTGFYLKRVGKKDSWIRFLYERLSDFCYDCGRVSHVRAECRFSKESSESGMKFGPELRAISYQSGSVSSTVQPEQMEASLTENTVKEMCDKIFRTGSSLVAASQGTEEGVGGESVEGPMELCKGQTAGNPCTLGDVEQVMDLSIFPAKEKKNLASCTVGKTLVEKDVVVTDGFEPNGLNAGPAQTYFVEEPPDSPNQSFSSSLSSWPVPSTTPISHVPIGPLVSTNDLCPSLLTQPVVDLGLSNFFNKTLSLKRKTSPNDLDPTQIKAPKLINYPQSSHIDFFHSQINPVPPSAQTNSNLNLTHDPFEHPHTTLSEYKLNPSSQINPNPSTSQIYPDISFPQVNPSPSHKPALANLTGDNSSNKGVVRRSPRRGARGGAVEARDAIGEGRLVDDPVFQVRDASAVQGMAMERAFVAGPNQPHDPC